LYVYDHQLTRKRGIHQESRTLLAKNGREKAENNARLEAMKFYPLNMVSGRRIPSVKTAYASKTAATWTPGEWTGHKVLISEAAEKGESTDDNPSGNVWPREQDGAILKINGTRDRYWVSSTSTGNYVL